MNIYICINFYSYSRIGTDENNKIKKKVDCVLLTTIRKIRNHCQDVDHCTTIRKASNDCLDVEHCQEDNW